MFVTVERALRVSAWLACLMVVAMLGIFLVLGVGQDPLQYVHSSAEYRRLLLANPAALRACLGCDNAFVVFYTTTFVTLGVVLRRLGADPTLLRTALGLLLSLALLDLAENFHFLVMLAAAEQGLAPSPTEIAAQVWESLLKFHVSYLGLFLLALALPRRSPGERALAGLSLYLQLPVGVLIYVTPPAVALPLVLVRFAYFLVSLLLLGLLFGRPAAAPGERSPVATLSPAAPPVPAG